MFRGAVWNFVVSPLLGAAAWFSGLPQKHVLPRISTELTGMQAAVAFGAGWLGLQFIIGRRLAAGRPCPRLLQARNLEGKTIIVTGTGSGAGFHTALQLAKQGATVILANRSAARSRECAARMRAAAAPCKLQLVTDLILELESLQSASKFAKDVLASYSRIDALVMNAGMADFARRMVTLFDGDEGNHYEFCTAVNAVSNVLVVMLLLPLLKRSGGRVVLLSSIAHGCADMLSNPAVLPAEMGLRTPRDVLQFFCGEHSGGYESWLALDRRCPAFSYGFAKYIMVSFADYLSEKHGVQAVSLQPGSISGGFYRHLPWLVQKFVGTVGYCLTQRYPREGAQTSLWATLAPWEQLESLATQQGTQNGRGALYANNIQVGKRCNLALQVDPGLDAVEWLIETNLKDWLEKSK